MARPKNGDERREQVLTAFETCVVRDSLAKTTLQKVATEAGLPRSLVRYHVGNKADMVTLLIERMMERADEGLARQLPNSRATNIHDLLDFLFEGGLSDETANLIIPELWHLAIRDDHIKSRLTRLYQRVVDILSSQIEEDGLGQCDRERQAVAFSLMSLAYGDAGMTWLNLVGEEVVQTRRMADALIETLQPTRVTKRIVSK